MRRPLLFLLVLVLTLVAWPGTLGAQEPTTDVGGGTTDVGGGTTDVGGEERGGGRTPVTPAGWRVDPAGTEIGVSKLASGFQGPLGADLSPDGTQLLAASSGAARIESVDLFDLDARTRRAFVPYDALRGRGESTFYGVAFSPDGRRAWASGGGQDVVHAYDITGSGLRETATIPTPFFPAGLAYGATPGGDRIYVANNLSAPASSAAGNPPGNRVTVIDPATNQVTGTIDLGVSLQPFGVAFTRDGAKAYVTNWMGRSVSVIATATERKTRDILLSPQNEPLQADHPSALAANPERDEIYTANANSDTVSVLDSRTDHLVDTIDVALVRRGPKGANPTGLDVSPDGASLYVTLAGENAVAVVDLDRREVRGFIPTSWYPSDVDVGPDGERLVVLNTNNSGAGPNPCGALSPRTDCPAKDPERDAPNRETIDPQYQGSMIKGSVSLIPVPDDDELGDLSESVERNNQARARVLQKPRALDAVRHVIYVIKENRTYDQVFGSLPRGNGDARLNLFGEESAPNHRELARRFGIVDNFYADAEVSADGHNWATQANATDYVDRTWPINYSPRPRSSQRVYDFENVPLAAQFSTEPLASDPSVPRSAAAQTVGYLWDNAYDHGVSYRSYGEYTRGPGDCSQPPERRNNESDTTRLNDARFGDHVNNRYPGYNTRCSDHADRYPEWEREFREFERNGQLPQLSIVRLPNDHAEGTTPGRPTPRSYVADNDIALGRMVETLSRSRYWRNTVMLVTEDDAQNGPDHVDAHRTIALAISPYTQHRRVDSTHYDTASMIATAEDLLNLPPMAITDARASRMWRSFSSRPITRPYTAIVPETVPFGAPGAPLNAPTAPMARESLAMDFTKGDDQPEIELNETIWKSIKGRHSEMPRPRHTKIIGTVPNDEEEEAEEDER